MYNCTCTYMYIYQVTTSPPMSPPPDKTTVRQHRQRLGSGTEYDLLPNQANPSAAVGTSTTKGLTPSTTTSTNAGATGLNSVSKGSWLRPIHLSSQHGGGGGPQSLPSPTNSSGGLSSGELLSSGDRLSSGEHPVCFGYTTIEHIHIHVCLYMYTKQCHVPGHNKIAPSQLHTQTEK